MAAPATQLDPERQRDSSKAGLLRDRRGVVMIEFVIVLVPMMLFFFAVLQYGLTSAASLVVRHSAVVGARAAVVVFDDGNGAYGGADRGLIWDDGELSERAQKVREATYLPLAAVAPAAAHMVPGISSAHDGLGDTLSRLFAHVVNRSAFIAVTFPTGPGAEGDDFHRDAPYGPTEDITVRVTMLFRCMIPMASVFMCRRGTEILTGLPVDEIVGAVSSVTSGELFDAALKGDFNRVRELSQVDEARARAEGRGGADQSQAMRELAYVDEVGLQWIGLLGARRFMILSAEATLPNQGARYYPREGDGG